MAKLKNRKQIRLKDYDYSSDGYYFITVCSFNKNHIFGSVGAGLASAQREDARPSPTEGGPVNGHIILSKLGQIIDHHWNEIPNHFGHVELDNYVIMPNHIHGILIIDNPTVVAGEDARPSPTLSDVICSFKSRCTVEYIKYIKQNDLDISAKIWERSFYDRIIRNERSLNAIREYIAYNPINWEKDIENLLNR
jgi:putative transposase